MNEKAQKIGGNKNANKLDLVFASSKNIVYALKKLKKEGEKEVIVVVKRERK